MKYIAGHSCSCHREIFVAVIARRGKFIATLYGVALKIQGSICELNSDSDNSFY